MTPLRRKILFVCTGNTCRSPMAEHLFRKRLADAGLAGIEVRSAGLSPASGAPLPPEAARALADDEVVNIRHAATSLDAATVDWADLILTMERSHRDAIVARHPRAAEKTEILKVFAGTAQGRDGIADPYGGDDADYRAALADIRDALTAIVRHWSPADPRGRAGK